MSRFTWIAIILVSCVATTAMANQPLNPGFEQGTVGSVPDNWIMESGKDFQKIAAIPEAPTVAGGIDTATDPFEYNFPDAGSYFAGIWYPVNSSSGDVSAMYQQVAVPTDSTGGATARCSVYSSPDGGFNFHIWLGVDPTGGTDPTSANVYWRERWEEQWSDAPPSPGDHEWMDVIVPDPGDGSAVGGFGSWNNYDNVTTPIQADGSIVTVFLVVEHKWLDRGGVIRWDEVALTGDWANTVAVGDPPEVSGLTTPADDLIRDVSVGYTLTDDENADNPATLSVDYAVGAEFDSGGLTVQEVQTLNSANVALSSDDGNGTGTGNLRLSDPSGTGDVAGQGGSTEISSPIVTYPTIDEASTTYFIQTKITDLELGTEDWAGAGIVVLRKNSPTDTGAPYFATLLRRNAGNDILNAEMKGSTGSYANDSNLWADIPTDGTSPIYLRARRGATGVWRGDWSYDGSTWNSAGKLDPVNLAGTDIDYGEELTVGLFVQNGATANFDYITSGFVPASAASGLGDGVTGLASDSSGATHTYFWDAIGDLGVGAFSSRVQLRLNATDDDGPGSPATTNIFQFTPPDQTGVQHWIQYR